MVNLQMNVRVSGDNGTVSLDALTFSTQGTPDPSIIEKAILCYTGPDNLLSIERYGELQYIRHHSEPNGTFVFSGRQDLPIGNNYFWLVYVVKPGNKAGVSISAYRRHVRRSVGKRYNIPNNGS